MTTTSIVKKVLMALTGLIWVGFVIGHLTGNFLLFVGVDAFNGYAEKLESLGPLLIVVEAGLVAFLLLHIYSGIKVNMENRAARPQGYSVSANGGRSSLASRTMPIGGIILAIFIVTHVKMFKFGDMTVHNGLWGLVMKTLGDPLMAGWYLLALVALGLHLSHGFSSAFQSMGVLKPEWRPKFKTGGVVLGWLIAAGFASMPIFALWLGNKS